MTETLSGGIMIDHRVHGPGIDAEIQSRSPEFPEVAQIVAPVRLRNDRNPVTMLLKPSGDNRRPEGGMVDESIAREHDYVDVIPSESLDFFRAGRNHIPFVVFHDTRLLGLLAFFGIVKEYRTPAFGSEATAIVPPWKSTAFFTMDNPRPVPPIFRLRPLSTR